MRERPKSETSSESFAITAEGERETVMWYTNSGKDKDVVLSTRVRLARNIAGYPFPGKMTAVQSDEIIDKVRKACMEDGWNCVNFEAAESSEKASFLEKHLVSREFVRSDSPRVLMVNDEKSVYIMTPEEDHLRIQSIVPGFDVDTAMDRAFETEEMIDAKVGFAYSERYGYITHCPTNLGTGMRISVMVHLPAYTANGAVRNLSLQLERIGMTVRGMDGEGSRAAADIYQISNQTTLGVSEDDVKKKFTGIIEQIIKNERELRSKLSEEDKEDLAEKARRDYGILMYAKRLNAAELVSMYTDMRYAAAEKLTDIPVETLDEMLIRSLPNTIVCENEGVCTPSERDLKRAETVRSIIGQSNG